MNVWIGRAFVVCLVVWCFPTHGESLTCFMAGQNVMAEATNKPINGATICLPAGKHLSLPSRFPGRPVTSFFSPRVSSPSFSPLPLSTILCDPEMKFMWGFTASVWNSRGFCAAIISESTYNDDFFRSLSEQLDTVEPKDNLSIEYYFFSLSNVIIFVSLKLMQKLMNAYLYCIII